MRAPGRRLEAVPGVTGVRFVSQAEAYESLRSDFAGNKGLLKEFPAKALPESFRVRVAKGAEREPVSAAVERRPGVSYVADEADMFGNPDWSGGADISVTLCVKDDYVPACRAGRGAADGARATAREKKAIVSAIEKMPGVTSYVFEDQKTAYRNFAEDFADNEALVQATRPSDLPEAYRLTARPEADWNLMSRRPARLNGVHRAYNARCLAAKATLGVKYGIRYWVALPDSKVCAPGAR
ncbi:permease-like cell division protein FtsX [Nonomuraea rubra]|uniref:permease-like cell division protein FtsX n=1 Tax=Nonomuraea rubra TaxID=46180 RepID=UPI0028A9000F|nr:permease-like cell division protein FtsX [Nonomuraea rubra]